VKASATATRNMVWPNTADTDRPRAAG
jgi:hypothetical protein